MLSRNTFLALNVKKENCQLLHKSKVSNENVGFNAFHT